MEKVRVKQVDFVPPKQPHQRAELAYVPPASHAQHGYGNALGQQHLFDLASAQGRNARHVKPRPVQAARQFVHDPLGARSRRSVISWQTRMAIVPPPTGGATRLRDVR